MDAPIAPREQLRLAGVAHAAAIMAWLFPDDPETQEGAQIAFHGCGMDYAAWIAESVDALETDDDTARRTMCDMMATSVMHLHANCVAVEQATCPDVVPDWMEPA